MGSTGRIAEGIAAMAAKHGWDCYMVHGQRYVNPSAYTSYQVSSSIEERIHFIKSTLFDAQGRGSRLATKQLVKFLKEISPDVVHIHNIHGCYINYQILFDYLTRENIPIIWTLHDCWSFTGHCMYFDRIECDRWKKGCFNCPQKKFFPRSIIDRSARNYAIKKSVFCKADNIVMVPVSEWLCSLLQQSFLGSKRNLVIHNGIDLSIFKPVVETGVRSNYSLGNKRILLGVANGFSGRKGLDDFILLSKHLSEEQVIVLVGAKETEISQVPKQIIALPRTNSQQELVSFYSSADIFLNLTYEDNFPTTNLEALACGTPVITYQTGGSPEAIDENTGIVVPQGDIRQLEVAINKILTRGKDAYSNACRKRALSCFDKSERFEDYIKLYEELISEKK